MLDALDVADRFRAGSDLDKHWEALARFRRALEPGVRMDRADAEANLGMTDFLSGLEVTLADRFSISPRNEGQFAIIPFLGETVEAAEHDGEQISEAEAELQEGRLQAFQDKAFARGARPAYKLGAQSYLVVDPAAAPVLKVMTDMQRADPITRAAFIRNPRQRITDAVTDHLRARGKLDGLSPAPEQELIEQTAEPAFVETREYSERVIGLTVYEKSALGKHRVRDNMAARGVHRSRGREDRGNAPRSSQTTHPSSRYGDRGWRADGERQWRGNPSEPDKPRRTGTASRNHPQLGGVRR